MGTHSGHVLPCRYANDLDMSAERGIIYFTDSQEIPVALNYGIKGAAPWYDTFRSFLFGLYSVSALGISPTAALHLFGCQLLL
jgi:hypothetical protein